MEEKNVLKEKWFTVKEASHEAGVSGNTINNAIKEGKLVARQMSDSSRWGFHYLISESELLTWVEDRKTVKANAITTSKISSDANAADIAEWITLRIKKAYDEGYKDGKRAGIAEVKDAIRGVK